MKKEMFIVRADRAGVFFGEISKIDGSTITMTNVRKLHRWDGAGAVEQLALDGVSKPNNCRFTVVVKECTILNVIQYLPCTQKAIDSLTSVKEWKA